MIAILIMSAKLADPGLCKIKILGKKGFDVISVYDVTNKILKRDWNYIVDAVI